MSSGCRVTNALDISVQFSRYTGIFVFWNALPDADSEHRLSQTVHCRSPGMTIAGFFRFVLITEFTPFLQDLCFISYDGFSLGFSLVPEGRPLPPFSLRDGATVKTRPQKHRRNRRNRRASSRGGVSTTDRSEICLLFLLKLVCTFWTTTLHLRQQMGQGELFLLRFSLWCSSF